MALRACIEALRYVRAHRGSMGAQHAVIWTDSEYAANNQSWAIGWKANRWRKIQSGEPVANHDLWDELLTRLPKTGRSTQIRYLPRNSNLQMVLADKQAKAARSRGASRKDFGFRVGKLGRSKTPGTNESTMLPAKGQTELVHVYWTRRVGLDDECQVHFDLYSKKVRGFVSQHYAYAATEDIANAFKRGNCFEATFGLSLTYSKIERLRKFVCPN